MTLSPAEMPTPVVYTLVDAATGDYREGPARDADAWPEVPADAVVVETPPPTPGSVWRPAPSQTPLGAWVGPPPAPSKLTVAQFRARWTWAERVAFEAAALTDPEMRAIANELAARVGEGVDPRSATMASLSARVVAHGGIIAETRRVEITAPVGTYANEPGYLADADDPAPPAD